MLLASTNCVGAVWWVYLFITILLELSKKAITRSSKRPHHPPLRRLQPTRTGRTLLARFGQVCQFLRCFASRAPRRDERRHVARVSKDDVSTADRHRHILDGHANRSSSSWTSGSRSRSTT